jgi:uncharacterized protein
MGLTRRDLMSQAWQGLLVAQLPCIAFEANSEPVSGQLATVWKPPIKGSIRQIENAWIDIAPRLRLAARLWLPENPVMRRVPVVLEYIPYRKRDTTRAVDDVTGQYLAEHGIAFARVDVPGSGDSDGLLADEYLEAEQNACIAVIEWLAAQPWCSGAVGMRGYSWGAQSALHAAMRDPPALKAIMPFCASDHRFIDDAHWIGGALGFVNLQWGTFFKGVQASPPDPAIFGERWREMWLARLEAAGQVIAKWTSHQCDDAYWRNGDVSVDYSAIKCPVYVVGGLIDAYTDSIPRMLERLKCHRQALIGPWAHGYPEFASPGPGLEWGPEELRWWYQWLLEEDTGISREPKLRIFMPDSTASEVYPGGMSGHWIAEQHWPPASQQLRTLWFAPNCLMHAQSTERVLPIPNEQLVGLAHPEWLPSFQDVDLPREQSNDDSHSLTFDSETLTEHLEMLGIPVVHLSLISDQPVAHVAVRLNEVLASGQSWNVTYGILNLCHRHGSEHPAALVPGRIYDVELPLHFCAHRLKKGSKIRVAVSPSLWPLVWSPPRQYGLKLHIRQSRLILPLNAKNRANWTLGIAEIPADNPVSSGIKIHQIGPDANGRIEIQKEFPRSSFHVNGGTTDDDLSSLGTDRFEGWTRATLIGEPANANAGSWNLEFEERFHRGTQWDCRIEVGATLRSDSDYFYVTEWIRAFEREKLLYESNKETPIERRLV